MDNAAHGHATWHGPHESPTAMTFPLMALAVGAIVAGFVGWPIALGGSNSIEQFLEPSFTASHVVPVKADATETKAADAGGSVRLQPDHAAAEPEHDAAPHVSTTVELGLMGFSFAVAVVGIWLAYRFYVASPEISEQLAERFAGAHRTLLNKYYVDELYNATVIQGTMSSGRGLWSFDRTVVDGMVNGTSKLTIVTSFFSGAGDKNIVDGLVNLVGWTVQESSHAFRRLQTGLVQNYALLMVFGIFAFIGIYLFVR